MSEEFNEEEHDAKVGQSIATTVEACIHYAMHLALNPDSPLKISLDDSMNTISSVLAYLATTMTTPFREFLVDEWHRQIDIIEERSKEKPISQEDWKDLKERILKDNKEGNKEWLN